MKQPILVLLSLFAFFTSTAQKKSKFFDGMYVQWGYNKEWFTKSNIHFNMSNGDRFTLHNAKAHDKPDMEAIFKYPADISIPQYNYRMGFYLNKNHTRAVEVNFDHIKYVVTDGQKLRVTGRIDKVDVDGDSVMNEKTFLHLEHTDGGNLLHLNYVQQKTLLSTRDGKRPFVNLIWKVGAGINIPRTDFVWRGDRPNNQFHIAGYNISGEGGARVYASKKLFFEFTGKSGYVKYVDALANTTQQKGNRVKHGFGYFELVALIGYDINF